ncbi:protein starmaker-like isoform X2 [Hetaerina americana]|uniref:protein starmaker-like isoform X2 n=1 Tax=Hetaerina americana TaxID=62018 RepID=UPI003A7F31AB
MDFRCSNDIGKDERRVNNNQHGKWEQLQESDTDQDEKYCKRGDIQKFSEWPLPKDFVDGNEDLHNLQRLAMEHQRSPFPDFLFDTLENQADTDDNGCKYDLATGSRKKQPTRMDSWEDNWLFQQKKDISQTSKKGSDTLMSMKIYGSIDEQNNDAEDYVEHQFKPLDYSDECKSREVKRVERPCVSTSSSSSDAEDLEESDTSESPSRKSDSIQSDDKIPFVENNPSPSENSDSTDSSEQARHLDEHEYMEDMAPTGQFLSRERTNNFSKNSYMIDPQTRNETKYSGNILKTPHEDVNSDYSIKDELLNNHGDQRPYSISGNIQLPKLLIERSHSPRPVSGTKSCTSEDSSGNEFEKRAAACRSRRRASWCPPATPVTAKKRGKRRTSFLPKRAEKEEPGELEVEPLSTGEAALVGLERQMLHRNAHHSSFRAKKASPNFVLNPLYVPEGEGVHHPRQPDVFNEPNPMHHLQPLKSESGYSSCSPDSMVNPNNMALPQHDMFFLGVRDGAPNPPQQRIQMDQSIANAHPDSSFLW